VRATDPGVDAVVARILAHRSAEGPFQLPMNVAVGYGGSGSDQWAWALCDAPLVAYALIGLGLGDGPAVRAAVDHMVALVRTNGWPCAVSKELGTFRGPGRKDDPCPFATPFVRYDLLHVLDVLSRHGWLREDARLLDMLGVLRGKADTDGRFTAESVWAAWKDWEFGQKKAPSRWVTLLAWRIIARMSESAP
jgi:hypothetical protein